MPPGSADAEMQRLNDRLSLIVETQRDIVIAGTDLEQIMQLVVERSMTLTIADGAFVSMVEGDELVVVAAAGTAAHVLGSRRRIEASSTFHAWQARGPLLISHCEDDARINQQLRTRIGDRSLVCVPLLNGDDLVASLNVTRSSETDRLGEEELKTLELVAVVLSSAVSRAAEFEAKRVQVEMLARFEAMYDCAAVGMMMMALDGTILDANPAMHRLLRAQAGDLTGRQIRDFVPDPERDVVSAQFRRMVIEGANALELEHRLIQSNGDVVWTSAGVSMVRNAEAAKSFVIVMMHDITQRKVAEAGLQAQSELNEYQATHDGLTALPNRTLLRDRVALAIESGRRQRTNVALLVMDLDGFKAVNDSLGHTAGDEVLAEVAQRLSSVLRRSDTAARLGGDEFAVLLNAVVIPQDVEHVVARIRDVFAEPILARGIPVSVAVPIGVSLFPRDGDDLETLMHAADIAMYQAKRTGAGHVFHHDLPQPIRAPVS